MFIRLGHYDTQMFFEYFCVSVFSPLFWLASREYYTALCGLDFISSCFLCVLLNIIYCMAGCLFASDAFSPCSGDVMMSHWFNVSTVFLCHHGCFHCNSFGNRQLAYLCSALCNSHFGRFYTSVCILACAFHLQSKFYILCTRKNATRGHTYYLHLWPHFEPCVKTCQKLSCLGMRAFWFTHMYLCLNLTILTSKHSLTNVQLLTEMSTCVIFITWQ